FPVRNRRPALRRALRIARAGASAASKLARGRDVRERSASHMMRAKDSAITKAAPRRLKVLALAPYPEEAASTRFRIAQFVPLLGEMGITCELKPFIDAPLFKQLYRKERMTRNALGIAWATMKRGFD